MIKYFVVSDTHSYFTILHNALVKQGFDETNPDHRLVLCGDLLDRGPESRQLLDFVRSLGERFIYIRGNHEDLLCSCVRDIGIGYSIEDYHYSNGTIRTISQLCDIDESLLNRIRIPDSIRSEIVSKMKGILDWINYKSIDYCMIGDYILVHGWMPTKDERTINGIVAPMSEWSKPSIWEPARWANGMDSWNRGLTVPNKTVVCGHYHCSWGHSHLHQDRKEFPQKNRKDWEKSFEPFVDDGIIAIDACTAYSGLCNVIVLEVEE